MAISFKTAITAYRVARVLPIVPLALGAVAIVGCAKVVSDVRKTRPLAMLEGSEWGLKDTDQFIAFKTKGEVIGNGGCNNFFGTYSQDGETLTFGPLASTKKACLGKMEAETVFMNAVQNARAFEATHLEMSLKDDKGETVLRLQRRDWD
jgi:heat shock protein HslJ